MSSVDAGITAALLNSSLNHISSRFNYSAPSTNSNLADSRYKDLVQQWNELVDRWNDLLERYNSKEEIIKESFKQTKELMTFINYGRICSGHEPLTLSEIVSTVNQDPIVAQFHQHLVKVGLNSKIGFISQSDFYWKNIKFEVFDYLKHVVDTGDDYQNLYPDFNKADALQGIYGEISGYQRISNLRLNNQMLVERNRKLKIENCDLLDEVDRLNEEVSQLRAQLNAQQNV